MWGTLTCTWFGLSPEQLPQWLRSLSIPVISNVYADKLWQLPWTAKGVGLTTAQNLQIFCFTLALIQLTVAHIKGALRNKSSLKALGDIGAILQLLGIYYVVLSLVVNSAVFSFGLVIGGIPVGTSAIILIGVGFVVSFVFSNYEGSVVKSILASLTNIVSVLLGVVNVFSDIVSYIRLWAVGLAGAAIGTALCYLTILVLNMVFIAVKVGYFPSLRRSFIRPFAATIICIVPCLAVNYFTVNLLGSKLSTIASIGVAAVVYVVALLLLKGIAADDIKMLPKSEKILKILRKARLISE
jgi:V/A-type H+-transporting ATPase subunit I